MENIGKKSDYDTLLCDILDIYADNWEKEPLDGDEVDQLCEFLKERLNLINGNQ